MHLKHKIATAIVAALAATASPGIHAAPRIHALPGHHGNRGPHGTEGAQADPSTCDPFAYWDDEIDPDGSGGDDGDDSTTNDLMHHPFRANALVGSDFHGTAAQIIGTSPDTIARNFLGVISRNLANAGTASRVARLSDKELAALARHAAGGTPQERADLLKLFATRLDGPALVRVARAFGRAPVEAAVRAYAAPATRTSFANGIAGVTSSPGGGGSYPSPSPPRPTIDMTLEEIYLEFRTAPVGSLSPAASLAETAMFVGRKLSPVIAASAAIGTGISWLIQTYAPELDDAIGGTIAAMIDNFWAATDSIEQGHYEAAFDDLFNWPVTSSSHDEGDWDISWPMVNYYQWTGTCGY